MDSIISISALHSNLSLEDIFILVQRELLKPLIGEEKAKNAVDYFEEGCPTGAFALLSPKIISEHIFIEQCILGPSSRKLESFYLPIGEREDESYDYERTIAKDCVLLYNPEILYSSFLAGWRVGQANALPANTGEESTGANLFLLRKNALGQDEESSILERASFYRNVLSHSLVYYEKRNISHRAFIDPWQGLRLTLETILIKIDTSLRLEFTKEAVIEGFLDADPDGYHGQGYYVIEEGQKIVLKNTYEKERFSYLQGKRAVYHSFETSPWGGEKAGKLLATIQEKA